MTRPSLFLFSSSSSSLGYVASQHEMQHQDLKQESNNETEHITSEPLVNSPDAKRQMEIDIANGASVRTAYQAMREALADRGASTEGT